MNFSIFTSRRTLLIFTQQFFLVIFALSCAVAAQQPPPNPRSATPAKAESAGVKVQYVGSETCKRCHLAAYQGWKKSRMANILLDPSQHPEAVVGDFAHPDPVRTFTLDDVAFTYGGRFKQRYFTKRGDDYFPLPAQWDVQKHRWLPYHVETGTDWLVSYYGPTNFDRPTGPGGSHNSLKNVFEDASEIGQNLPPG